MAKEGQDPMQWSVEKQLKELEKRLNGVEGKNESKEENKPSGKTIFSEAKQAFEDFFDVQKQIDAATKKIKNEEKKQQLLKLRQDLKKLKDKHSKFRKPTEDTFKKLFRELGK